MYRIFQSTGFRFVTVIPFAQGVVETLDPVNRRERVKQRDSKFPRLLHAEGSLLFTVHI